MFGLIFKFRSTISIAISPESIRWKIPGVFPKISFSNKLFKYFSSYDFTRNYAVFYTIWLLFVMKKREQVGSQCCEMCLVRKILKNSRLFSWGSIFTMVYEMKTASQTFFELFRKSNNGCTISYVSAVMVSANITKDA